MKVYVTGAGVRVPRPFFTLIVSLITAVLTLTMLPSNAFAEEAPINEETEQPLPEDADSDGDGTADRPDIVSAAATARVLKKPIEDMSQRTETVQVLVNPDGTLTQNSYASAVKTQTSPGEWTDVDYTLEKKSDGTYGPKAAPGKVSIGGGGSDEIATVHFGDGRNMSLSWPEELPEPEVSGGVATFKVGETTDLMVSVTAEGLATRIRLNEAPATPEEATVALGMKTTKVSVSETELGQLQFETPGQNGKTVQTSAAMAAWDAQLDEADDPINVVAVQADVSEDSVDGQVRENTVELKAPADFLTDPGTQYPVVIDPDIGAVTYGQDTWVRSGTTIVDTLPYRLMVGRIGSHSSTSQAHSFIQWDNAELSSTKVLKADLHLFQYHSGSCSNKQMNIHPLNATPWDEATTTYSTSPAGMTGTGTSATPVLPQKGGTGCAYNGWISTSIKQIVQAWADGPSTGFINNGLTMNVPSAHNSDVAYERRFCSKDFDVTHSTCNTASRVPYLSVTYNGPPGVPGAASTPSSRTFDGDLYVAGTRPVWSVAATDPESSRMTYEFELRGTPGGAVLGTCTSGQVASGGTAGCAPDVDLVDHDAYVLKSRATDEHGLVGDWSDWQEFTADLTPPGAVSIDCSDYDNDTWYDERGSETTTCDFTTADTADFEWRRTTAGTVEDRPALPASSNSATTPAIDVPANGVMRIEARAKSKSGQASAWKTYTFGVGTSVLTEPMRDDRSTSTFPVKASAGEGATSAKIQWRYAPEDEGDTTTGWADATQVKVASSGAAWTGAVSGTGISETPRLMWTPAQESGLTAPSVVQVRVVFAYPGSVTMPSPMQQVQVVPHAFGSTFPTKEVGPAEVGLFSGEMRYSATDVDIAGPDDSLAFARTHLSLAGEQAGPAGVLGPGWIADFGNGQGASGFVVLDRTASDGTITLMSPNGEAFTYAHSSGTVGDLKIGTYKGIGEAKLEKDTLKLDAVTGETGISHKLTLTERSGVVTEFKRTTAGVWSTARVIQPKDNGETTYVRDSAGLITWVFSPYVTGLTCTPLSTERGCRALNFNYITVAGQKRLDSIELRTWDPKPGSDGKPSGSATMAWKEVAQYAYDTNGYLIEAWNPLSWNDSGTTPLKTAYEYDTTGGKTKLTKVTGPGMKPWRFAYDTTGRLDTINRQHDAAVGSGDATWTVKYDLATSGGGLPDVTTPAVTAWGQLAADAPTAGAAVWGPSRVPATSPSAADYEYAFLAYYTHAGRTVNAAEFGAGAWQIDSTRYDAQGNNIWQLGADGRNRALAESSDPEASAGLADKYASFTVYNAAGTRIENTYSPMRTVVLDNGDTVVARSTTATDYDNEADGSLMPGRPTTDVPEGGYDLPVEERVAVTDKLNPAALGNIWDSRKTRYRYDKIVSIDADTWKTGQATRVLTEDGSDWSTKLSRYDKYGYLIETRTPAGTAAIDDTANDVRSTKYVYYSANGDASESACRNKPEWAGLACVVKPGGAPSAGSPAPTIKTLGYTMMWATSRSDEVGDTAVRSVVTAYDYIDRQAALSVTVTGSGATSTSVATRSSTYSTTTGLLTSVGAGSSGTESITYDSWGRSKTRTDSSGNTATSTYDTATRVATADDGKGTYSYGYDGTDSRGLKERRGLITSLDVGLASGPDVLSGAYDASKALIEQQLPGGVKAVWTRDITGAASAVEYEQGGEALVSFSQSYDHFGRVRVARSPDSTQAYKYDDRDRLVQVDDSFQGQCSVRTYEFDGDSNRTNAKTYAPGSGGTCQDATPSTDVTTSFDTGDRITTAGYVHDKLGRATTIPAAHTDTPDGSNLTAAYHANDMVRSLAQTIPDDDAGSLLLKQEFSLDALDRVSVTKGYTAGVQLTEATNKYSSAEDSPAWVEMKSRPDGSTAWATTWTRNVSGLDRGLGILQPAAGPARLQLADLRGNVVASTTIGGSGLDSYSSFTEYGLSRTAIPTEYAGYGWHGTNLRRSGNIGGITLLGARIYNPATGRFLSRDSIRGGNDNAYVYPPDPINKSDLSGLSWFSDIVAAIVAIVTAVIIRRVLVSVLRPSAPKKSTQASSSSSSSKAKKLGPWYKRIGGWGDVGVDGCFFLLCLEGSVGFDGDPDITGGGGIGIGLGGGWSAGAGFGTNEGNSSQIACSGFLPFGGGFEIGYNDKDTWKPWKWDITSGGISVGGGLGGGCLLIGGTSTG